MKLAVWILFLSLSAAAQTASQKKTTTPAKPAAKPAARGAVAAARGATARGPAAAARRGSAVAARRGEPALHMTRSARGDLVGRDARGRVAEVHTRSPRGYAVVARRAPNGAMRYRVERPDHSVLVLNRAGHGYIERPYLYRGNVAFVQRSFYVHGVAYNRFYRPYAYRGVAINVYMPSRFFAPAFYGWAYYPFARPMPYAWGWAGSPWFGFYGAYFVPAPVYASPALWLTDYMVAASLQEAYAERQDADAAAAAAASAPPPAAPLDEATKQAIAAEVQRQINLERYEAANAAAGPPDPGSSGIARLLEDGQPHVFVVASGLSLQAVNGAVCPVSEGDVLSLLGPPAADAAAAELRVVASQGGDCGQGAIVSVAFSDLQDMQNHMREQIDAGLQQMQTDQGKVLPAAPAGTSTPPAPTAYAALAPPPDPNGAAELSQEAGDAAQATQAAVASTPPDSGGGN